MYRAPSQANLPHLLTLLNDVHGNIDQVARHLGISPATLRKYKVRSPPGGA
ncbi:helix-turn-helix domain-containing protein [Comamonas aquatilis]|uniref:helix-turn-helix domain-containing protein n=1 Tax=Comamonas aquatilis TaxID=1778406 RepID=UPI0039EF9ABD